MVQVLQNFPGAMIVVSHEEDFLQALGVDAVYALMDGRLMLQKTRS